MFANHSYFLTYFNSGISPHFEQAGWAPHAYFQMLADRNGAEAPGSSANSPCMHQTDIEIQPMGSVGSNSPG